MKVTKLNALRMTLMLALVGFASCASDQEQMDEQVEVEATDQDEFSEFDEFNGDAESISEDGVEDGLLTEEASYDDPYAVEDEFLDEVVGSQEEDFTGAQFDTTEPVPFDDSDDTC